MYSAGGLSEIREKIDSIDRSIRNLLMQRLECSRLVAETKIESGDYSVYRRDREVNMTEKLSDVVPENLKRYYVSSLKSIIAQSRAFQYDLIYSRKEDEIFAKISDYWCKEAESEEAATKESETKECGYIEVKFTEAESKEAVTKEAESKEGGNMKLEMDTFHPMDPTIFRINMTVPQGKDAVSQIVAAVYDNGFRLDDYRIVGKNTAKSETVSFTISGIGGIENLGKLIYRLADETGYVKEVEFGSSV